MAQMIYTFALDGTLGKAYGLRSRGGIERFFRKYLRRAEDTGWYPILHGTKKELQALGAKQAISGEWLYKTDKGDWILCRLTDA